MTEARLEFSPYRGRPAVLDIHRGTLAHWAVPLDPGRDTVLAAWRLLSTDERDRAERFHFDHDRRRYAVAHAAMRRLLAAYAGCAPQELRFATSARAKPVLSGPGAGLHFNLSHSGELALLGVSPDAALGVDIERVRRLDDGAALAGANFSAREYAAWRAVPPGQRDLAFFLCWTRKEAYVKAVGEGLYLPLDRFDVTLAPGEPARILSLDGDAGAAAAWSLHDLDPGAGYAAASAIPMHPQHVEAWTCDPEALLGGPA